MTPALRLEAVTHRLVRIAAETADPARSARAASLAAASQVVALRLTRDDDLRVRCGTSPLLGSRPS